MADAPGEVEPPDILWDGEHLVCAGAEACADFGCAGNANGVESDEVLRSRAGAAPAARVWRVDPIDPENAAEGESPFSVAFARAAPGDVIALGPGVHPVAQALQGNGLHVLGHCSGLSVLRDVRRTPSDQAFRLRIDASSVVTLAGFAWEGSAGMLRASGSGELRVRRVWFAPGQGTVLRLSEDLESTLEDLVFEGLGVDNVRRGNALVTEDRSRTLLRRAIAQEIASTVWLVVDDAVGVAEDLTFKSGPEGPAADSAALRVWDQGDLTVTRLTFDDAAQFLAGGVGPGVRVRLSEVSLQTSERAGADRPGVAFAVADRAAMEVAAVWAATVRDVLGQAESGARLRMSDIVVERSELRPEAGGALALFTALDGGTIEATRVRIEDGAGAIGLARAAAVLAVSDVHAVARPGAFGPALGATLSAAIAAERVSMDGWGGCAFEGSDEASLVVSDVVLDGQGRPGSCGLSASGGADVEVSRLRADGLALGLVARGAGTRIEVRDAELRASAGSPPGRTVGVASSSGGVVSVARTWLLGAWWLPAYARSGAQLTMSDTRVGGDQAGAVGAVTATEAALTLERVVLHDAEGASVQSFGASVVSLGDVEASSTVAAACAEDGCPGGGCGLSLIDARAEVKDSVFRDHAQAGLCLFGRSEATGARVGLQRNPGGILAMPRDGEPRWDIEALVQDGNAEDTVVGGVTLPEPPVWEVP